MIYNLGVFAALCASSAEGMKRPECREMMKNHRLVRRLKGEHLQPGWISSRRRLPDQENKKLEDAVKDVTVSARKNTVISKMFRSNEASETFEDLKFHDVSYHTFSVDDNHFYVDTIEFMKANQIPYSKRTIQVGESINESNTEQKSKQKRKGRQKTKVEVTYSTLIMAKLKLTSIKKKFKTADRIIEVGRYGDTTKKPETDNDKNIANQKLEINGDLLSLFRKILGYRIIQEGGEKKITRHDVDIPGKEDTLGEKFRDALEKHFQNELYDGKFTNSLTIADV